MSGSLRIGLVHAHSLPEVPRGGERYLDDLAWYLTRAGHHVEVLTGTDGPPGRDEVHGAARRRVRHLHIGALERRRVKPVDTFGVVAWPRLLGRRFDLVHALTPTAAVAARLAGHRTVYTVLGHPTREQFGARPFDRQLMGAAVRTANVVTAFSRASARGVSEVFGRSAEPLPLGVRLDQFPLREPPQHRGPRRVLFSGALDNPYKGLDVVLRAMARLLTSQPDVRLQVSGPGDHRWAFAQLDEREAATVTDAVDLLGVGSPLDEMPARYRAATVTALPSRYEAFGITFVESLASGTPVVCADDAGPPEIVDRPEVGRVVPVGDADALARALAECLALADEQDTARRCHEHARQWDWDESVGPAHERLYAGVVARRAQARVRQA